MQRSGRVATASLKQLVVRIRSSQTSATRTRITICKRCVCNRISTILKNQCRVVIYVQSFFGWDCFLTRSMKHGSWFTAVSCSSCRQWQDLGWRCVGSKEPVWCPHELDWCTVLYCMLLSMELLAFYIVRYWCVCTWKVLLFKVRKSVLCLLVCVIHIFLHISPQQSNYSRVSIPHNVRLATRTHQQLR